MSFRYQIFVDGQSKFDGTYICFAELNNYRTCYDKNKLECHYALTHSPFIDEEIEEFHRDANSWGFECEYDKSIEGKSTFKAERKYFYNYLIGTLVMRRYLEESGLPNIVRNYFAFKKANPDICTFVLFQLAHYYSYNGKAHSYNSHHALISRMGDIYSAKKVRKLVNVETVKNRLQTKKGGGSLGVGIDNIICVDDNNFYSELSTVNETTYPRTDLKKIIEALS